jgi:hypothetical protein
MKKRKILVLGDSFTYGHGCEDRIYHWDKEKKEMVGWFFEFPRDPPSKHCWASLLQNELTDYEVVNIARPGNSNQHMFGQLVDYFYNFKKEIDLVVYSSSFVDRIEAASMGDPERPDPWPINHTNAPGVEFSEYTEAKNAYIKYLYNGAIGLHQSMSAIYGAHSYTVTNGIKFLWCPPPTLPFDIIDRFTSIRECRMNHIHGYDFSQTRKREFNVSCHSPDAHVNEKGHKLYYVTLAGPRIKKVLSE